MAEARAEVLEEIIKNQNGLGSPSASPAASHTRSMDSLDERSESGDELSTFEKGVQKKFNSVSSSVNSFSSGENGETPADPGKPAKPSEAVTEETPGEILEVLDEETVKVTKKDGTVRGTVFGTSKAGTGNGTRKTAMDIARQLSQSESSLKPPVYPGTKKERNKSDSCAPLTSVGKTTEIGKPAESGERRDRSDTDSVQSEPAVSVSRQSSGDNAGQKTSASANTSRRSSVAETKKNGGTRTGTWFGSTRRPQAATATDVAKTFVDEKAKEDAALRLLDDATSHEPASEEPGGAISPDSGVVVGDSGTVSPVANGGVRRHGASRESYRNATERIPDNQAANHAVKKREVPLKDMDEQPYTRKAPKNNNELTAEEVLS